MKQILCFVVMALTCAGCAAQSYAVNLTWQASASSTPTLINVYRGQTTNGSCAGMAWVQIATGQPASGPYKDTAVQSGQGYCYEVRAYFASGSPTAESGSSNWAYVGVPTPKPAAPTDLYATPTLTP